jgi:hypothetical protein
MIASLAPGKAAFTWTASELAPAAKGVTKRYFIGVFEICANR